MIKKSLSCLMLLASFTSFAGEAGPAPSQYDNLVSQLEDLRQRARTMNAADVANLEAVLVRTLPQAGVNSRLEECFVKAATTVLKGNNGLPAELFFNKTSDALGINALHVAAANNDIEQARAILKSGAMSVNSTDKSGNTALMYATANRHQEMINLLADMANANKNICNIFEQNINSIATAIEFSIEMPQIYGLLNERTKLKAILQQNPTLTEAIAALDQLIPVFIELKRPKYKENPEVQAVIEDLRLLLGIVPIEAKYPHTQAIDMILNQDTQAIDMILNQEIYGLLKERTKLKAILQQFPTLTEAIAAFDQLIPVFIELKRPKYKENLEVQAVIEDFRLLLGMVPIEARCLHTQAIDMILNQA